jgi:hypothetical protein
MKKCEICGKEDVYVYRIKKQGKCLCSKHREQIEKFGHAIRTIYDPNKIIDCGDYYEICLYSGKSEQKEIARAKIDKEDLKKIKDYKWGLDGHGYVSSHNRKHYFKLHQIIIGKKDGYVIDHINHNVLDNRKENLRHITQHQNSMYCVIPKNNKSGYKGIYLDTRRNTWSVEIKFNYKKIFLGCFKNKEDAIIARKNAEEKYFGDFIYRKR